MTGPTEPKMSFVASCRLDGTTLFFIERFSTNFSESEVAMDDGRIPAWPSEEAARAELARRFPLPRGKPLTDHSTMAEVAAVMDDQFAPKVTLSYDLDAVQAWVRSPGPSGLTPEQALSVWELCWQVGEAPLPQRLDPMGMYAMQENIMRDPAHRDMYEIVLLGMKLSGLVIMAQEARRASSWELEIPDLSEFWPKTDFARLAGILANGVAGFRRRVQNLPAWK